MLCLGWPVATLVLKAVTEPTAMILEGYFVEWYRTKPAEANLGAETRQKEPK
jgi:hypothetical protein